MSILPRINAEITSVRRLGQPALFVLAAYARSMSRSATTFFSENGKLNTDDFGEKEMYVPRPLGFTSRRVTRGGFMSGVELTFMMFSSSEP